MNFEQIKLVIWDLDETFWKGTLSEGKIEIPVDNIKLIKNLTDCGVVCSICSKNDYEAVKKKLDDAGIWDNFVFQSIDWNTKGPRVKQIIDDMHLRYPNVLFLDDNSTNRAEVEFFCESIMTADVDVIPLLCDHFDKREKKDIAHKRLAQYKILEQKRNNERAAGNVYDFLKQSHIKVDIGYDCITYIDRIVDLVERSNQLNFTKLRNSKIEIEELCSDSNCKCGYVNVKDDYGDYGLVGFFAIKSDKAIHFTFSCRTLGMGIEQYVWNILGKPKVDIVGEVASKLESPVVDWINIKDDSITHKQKYELSDKIVVHGPCDVSSIFGFINDSPNIIKEFNYVNEKGISIEQRNCTTHIVESISFDKRIRESDTVRKLPFYDKQMFDTAIFDEDTAYVVLSLFTDPCLACYRELSTGLIVCFGDAIYDLTDKSRQDEYLSSSTKLHNCVFSDEDLGHMRSSFEYLGRIQPLEIVKNIDYIYNHIAEGCKLILTLQSEMPFETTNPTYKYRGVIPKKLDQKPRHIYNKELNDLLRDWADNKSNVSFLDFNQYITGPESFNDHISHFKRDVYYKMSCDLVRIITSDSNIKIKNHNRFKVVYDAIKNRFLGHLAGIKWRIEKFKTKKYK